MIEVDEFLNACMVCKSIRKGRVSISCEFCRFNFLKPLSKSKLCNYEGAEMAVPFVVRVLPRGWAVGHIAKSAYGFVVYQNKSLDQTVVICFRYYGSIIMAEVQFWKKKDLIFALSFNNFRTANDYASEYMRALSNVGHRESLEEFIFKSA